MLRPARGYLMIPRWNCDESPISGLRAELLQKCPNARGIGRVQTSMQINIAPIPHPFLERARQEGIDALGQPVRRMIATGGEPCRDVLRRAQPGEQLILASFSPFLEEGPYREFGPVFILASASEEDVARQTLPLSSGYFRDRFVLRAYSSREEILDAAMVTTAEAEAQMESYLAKAEVAFVHARFPLYGCFACRIDRSPVSQ